MFHSGKKPSPLRIIIIADLFLAIVVAFLFLSDRIIPQSSSTDSQLQISAPPAATIDPGTIPPATLPPVTEPAATEPPATEPRGDLVKILVEFLNTRSGPGTNYAAMDRYHKDDKVLILEYAEDSKGQTWGRTDKGWIILTDDYIRYEENAASEPPVTEAPGPAWINNVLRDDPVQFESNSDMESWEQAAAHTVLGSDIKRSQIGSVTILDTLKNAPSDAWDVSLTGDRCVLAWVAKNGNLYDLYIGAEGGINAPYPYHLFSGYTNVRSISLNQNLHTDYAQYMSCMFYACKSLSSLDLSSLNTSSASHMDWMFAECEKLTSLNLKGFITQFVLDFSYMFYGCMNLPALDLADFITPNAVTLECMFQDCQALHELNINNFDTSGVANMTGLFFNCYNLSTLDLSHFNTSSCLNMAGMFRECRSIRTLDLRSFDTSLVEDMYAMFYNCRSLEKLDLSSFNTANVRRMSWMFYCCPPIEARHVQHFDTGNVTEYENFMRGTEWHAMFK